MVDQRVGFATLVVDVLRDVQGSLVAFRAQGSASHVNGKGIDARWAVGCVPLECFHHVGLIVSGQTRVDGRGGEADLPRPEGWEVRHGGVGYGVTVRWSGWGRVSVLGIGCIDDDELRVQVRRRGGVESGTEILWTVRIRRPRERQW